MAEQQTKCRPILFSGPMVRAILEGRKTQTRRVVNPHVDIKEPDGNWKWLYSPYGKPGDRLWLWVRETASRITLEVTGVRVERLQEITHHDAANEGFVTNKPDNYVHSTALKHFMRTWDELNAKRGFSWDSNPYVWVIEFKRSMTQQLQIKKSRKRINRKMRAYFQAPANALSNPPRSAN